ncbi:MAG: serine protein kinase, partial [Deltaproteobacteria bacterium]|nr:serine protein kinase [Deltaproteobacteria bacterium]
MVTSLHDLKGYQELNWEGTLSDYIHIVEKDPTVARTAFQRVYDMILREGSEEYTEYKKKITHYRFFEDPFENGKDALYGLDLPLMKLVNVFQAAARRYGPEKRIILLHGPVGGAKSTIARLLKKGMERYSRTPEGALFTFNWVKNGVADLSRVFGNVDTFPCPMHEDPLH